MEQINKGESQPTNGSFDALKREHEAILNNQAAGTFVVDDQSKSDDDAPNDDQPIPTTPPAKDDEDDEEDTPGNDKKDDPEDKDNDPEDDDEGDADPDDEPTKDRKVIPIKRLHDERRKREEVEREKEELQKKLNDLTAITTKTTEGSQKESDQIKAWAEKNSYEPEEIEGLVGIIRAGAEVNQETVLKNVFGEGANVEVIREAVKIAKETKMAAQFDGEFKQVLPDIRKQYPNATEEQITEARKKLDEISHSQWGHDKDLDYILFKKKDELDKVFKTQTTERKTVKGPESSRLGQGAPRGLTAKDFTGKNAKPFTELAKLPESDRKRIESEMDIFTKQAYWHSQGGNTGDILKRGGKTVSKL